MIPIPPVQFFKIPVSELTLVHYRDDLAATAAASAAGAGASSAAGAATAGHGVMHTTVSVGDDLVHRSTEPNPNPNPDSSQLFVPVEASVELASAPSPAPSPVLLLDAYAVLPPDIDTSRSHAYPVLFHVYGV